MSSTVVRERPDAVPGLAALPAVDKLLQHGAIAALDARYGASQVKRALRRHLDALRGQAKEGTLQWSQLNPHSIAQQVATALELADRPQLRPVFNLTGTVLHTNLGRALLPDEAIQAVCQAMSQPCNLEFDLGTGRRGDRDSLIESLVCELTGAEAATVVNNNAAAVFLLLNTLAQRKQVLVSRGELVEIGGSFRIPDIMQRAGARMVEVGTTNRTHLADFESALGPRTALLMKVHCSNYEVRGFTAEVSSAQLHQLGASQGVPLAVDLGSGTLVNLSEWGLPQEPTVSETLQSGADLVTFSGDKLLGGPQAGIIVGRADLIQKIKKNPLRRALRVGKLTLAALEAVLRLYRDPDHLAERLTTLSLLTRPAQDLYAQAQRLCEPLQAAVGSSYTVAVAPMMSQIGSGALPVDMLPSYGLVVSYAGKGRPGRHLETLARRLRGLPIPVVGRIAQDAMWLDLRCLEPSLERRFVDQLGEM